MQLCETNCSLCTSKLKYFHRRSISFLVIALALVRDEWGVAKRSPCLSYFYLTPRHVHHHFRLEQYCFHRQPVSILMLTSVMLGHWHLDFLIDLQHHVRDYRREPSSSETYGPHGQGGQRLMLQLALSSSSASVLHILRGDSVPDGWASFRDNDAYPLCMHSYTSRMLFEGLIFILKYTNTWYSTFTPCVPLCLLSSIANHPTIQNDVFTHVWQYRGAIQCVSDIDSPVNTRWGGVQGV